MFSECYQFIHSSYITSLPGTLFQYNIIKMLRLVASCINFHISTFLQTMCVKIFPWQLPHLFSKSVNLQNGGKLTVFYYSDVYRSGAGYDFKRHLVNSSLGWEKKNFFFAKRTKFRDSEKYSKSSWIKLTCGVPVRGTFWKLENQTGIFREPKPNWKKKLQIQIIKTLPSICSQIQKNEIVLYF